MVYVQETEIDRSFIVKKGHGGRKKRRDDVEHGSGGGSKRRLRGLNGRAAKILLINIHEYVILRTL